MPAHFYGLPYPQGFTIEEVEHALMLARKDAMVQLLTFFENEGKPKRSSNINLVLLQVLINENGLEHDSQDLFEGEGQPGPLMRLPVAPRNTLEEQARMRYDYYRFTTYGREILEYYHLQMTSAEAQRAELLGEKKQTQVTKAQLLNVFQPKAADEVTFTGGPEKLLSEAFQGNHPEAAQLLVQQQHLLKASWGAASEGFQTRISPTDYQLSGLYKNRLDVFFRLGEKAGQKAGKSYVQVRACLYLLLVKPQPRLYLKASVSKIGPNNETQQHAETTRTLAVGETPEDVLSELIEAIRH